RLFTHFAPKSTLAESYRTLRTAVKFLCLEKRIKTILISSSSAGEGKSTASINLAITLAQSGCKTLLVEADLRKPVISGIFGIDREPGLCDAILGNCDWKETVRTVADLMMGAMNMEEIMITPGFDNLNIITSGEIPPNPSEIINSQRMTDFIAQAKAVYDVVIIDTAPILPVTDAAILGSKVDGMIILYRVGKIARGALKRAKIQMEQVKANILGVILNGLKPEMSSDYYQYGYDRYYAYHATGVSVKLPWYRRIVRKMRSFIVRAKEKAGKKQKSPQTEKAFSEKAYGNAWTSYIKIALLAAATISLIIGLLWQFEIIKTGHSVLGK
ncbi:MAG: CpsD/CapB family tyrosine-protein kinase, partial [Planctomycetes bacterium]|nr:CpsD/CapB family tyrosine-protein kinase [Planctomycetota bacterium]